MTGNVSSSLTLLNSTITGCSAADGGAIFSNGSGGSAVLNLTNCTVNQNAAQYGGGIYSDGTGSGRATLTVTNSTFNLNNSTNAGGSIYIDGLNPGSSGISTLLISNTILRAGTPAENLFNDGGRLLPVATT